MKPLLASAADLNRLRFPLDVSPKLDGIRALVINTRLVSRTLKEIPNNCVRQNFSHRVFEGLDGELIAGSPTDKHVYRNTVSAVMSEEGDPKYTFYVFDVISLHNQPYRVRREALEQRVKKIKAVAPNLAVHTTKRINSLHALLAYEQEVLDEGYEGLILRDPESLYKFGRSTAREGIMLKLKRFVDDEAEIIGIVEEMHNANEAKKDELGRTKRSSAKAGKVAKGRMGALIVRDVKTKVVFCIGTGFTAADREAFFKMRGEPAIFEVETGLGVENIKAWRPAGKKMLAKYKSFKIGVKDKPRHPVYLGLRDRRDM